MMNRHQMQFLVRGLLQFLLIEEATFPLACIHTQFILEFPARYAKPETVEKVEIVIDLEEEFGITVDDDSAQSIKSVQEAADLIDKIIEENSP
ncbi:Acyl carrier protein [Quillaja saponaria]|uniref:Acyl carrier protein n=1 Tax=Quillaja saponaria TaxID=32244 RepID=A0AAD7Q210_QUISA|nr:Acyl carrier protein [Quillaja saponaria]